MAPDPAAVPSLTDAGVATTGTTARSSRDRIGEHRAAPAKAESGRLAYAASCWATEITWCVPSTPPEALLPESLRRRRGRRPLAR